MTSSHQQQLIDAIEQNDISSVTKLLDDAASSVDDLNSLLRLAARRGNVEIVALLLDHGALVNVKDFIGETACHTAALSGHAATLQLLLDRGANPTVQNHNFFTPIDLLLKQNNIELLKMCFVAVRRNFPDDTTVAVCGLVPFGADIIDWLVLEQSLNLAAIRTSVGETLCHVVGRSINANLGALDKLIKLGVDLDARNIGGRTCTYVAVHNVDALRRLIAAGANVNIADNYGATPLISSVFEVTGESTVLLLAAGAVVQAHDIFDAVRVAATCGSMLALHALVVFGANIDESSKELRRLVTNRGWVWPPTADQLNNACQRIHLAQWSLVRDRAFEICIALQSLNLDAVRTIEILQHSCGPVAPTIPFHRWWQLATTVKHFKQ